MGSVIQNMGARLKPKKSIASRISPKEPPSQARVELLTRVSDLPATPVDPPCVTAVSLVAGVPD